MDLLSNYLSFLELAVIEDPLTAPTSSASTPQLNPERSSRNCKSKNSGLLAKRNFENPVLKTVKISSKTRSGNKPVAGTGLFKRKGVPRLTAELTNDSSDDGGEIDGDKEVGDGNQFLNGKTDQDEDHEIKIEGEAESDIGDRGEGRVKFEEDEEKENDNDDGESDEVIISPSRRKKMRKTRIAISSSSSGEDSIINLRKRRHRRRSSDSSHAVGDHANIRSEKVDQGYRENAEEDGDEDDEEGDLPISRKRMSIVHKPAHSGLRKIERNAAEHEEIQEDLEDLQSSLRMLLHRALKSLT